MQSLSLGVLLLDQLTKQLIVAHLRVGESLPIVPGVLELRRARNPTGLLNAIVPIAPDDRHALLVVLPFVLLVVLLFALRALESVERSLRVGVALAIGGAVGNVLDRLLRRSVVDFVSIGSTHRDRLVFNLADVAMLVGIALLTIGLARRVAGSSRLRLTE